MTDEARAVVNGRGVGRWHRGHPWIFRSDVVGRPAVGPGAVRVEDEDGRTVGMGLWSPSSEISLRMLTREATPVDASFWAEFWAERIGAALKRRNAVGSTAWRGVHGEADGLPSLVADILGDVVVVQLLSAGLEVYRAEIVDALRSHLSPRGILARNDVPVRTREDLPVETELLWGEVPDLVEVEESGVRYYAAPWTGQKTGAFLDQRENRAMAGRLARGQVLDAFCYHGSFALHMAVGAERVLALDSSAEALVRARENAALNGQDNVETLEANAFEHLRLLEAQGASFDVVVLDPPALAKHRSSLGRAIRGYKEINLRGMRLLAPGGHLLTFSCSYHVGSSAFRAMLESAAADSGRAMRWVCPLGQAADHPVILQIPETGYLKGALLQAVA
jgi:23S rRNA (cytosine1962-C5)-methyltransferase